MRLSLGSIAVDRMVVCVRPGVGCVACAYASLLIWLVPVRVFGGDSVLSLVVAGGSVELLRSRLIHIDSGG